LKKNIEHGERPRDGVFFLTERGRSLLITPNKIPWKIMEGRDEKKGPLGGEDCLERKTSPKRKLGLKGPERERGAP